MSIFDMFKQPTTPEQQQTAPPQQETPNNPGNIPTPSSPPTDGQVPKAKEEQVSNDPLESFKDIWDTVDNKDNSNKTPDQQLDASKVQEVVNKADFSNSINQESLAKIAQGGEEATTAFKEAMNSVAQQVMVQALVAANNITEHRVNSALKSQEKNFQELIRKQNTSEKLAESNPIFKNPAVKPVIEAAQSQLLAKNPNATSAEITAQAQDFVMALVESLSPQQQQDASINPDEEDWSKFLINTNR